MEPNGRIWRTITVILGLLLLAAWVLFRPEAAAALWRGVVAVATPFVLAAAFAFVVNLLLQPLERAWERLTRRVRRLRGLKRPVCLALSVLIIGAALFVLMFIVLPGVADTIVTVAESAPHYARQLEGWRDQLNRWTGRYGVSVPELDLNAEELGASVREWLREKGPSVAAGALGFTTSVVNGAFNVVLGIVLGLYMLADKERLIRQSRRVLEAFLPATQARMALDVAQRTNATFSRFVTGQLLDALIVGLLCYGGMLALNLPHAGAVSVLVGATNVIPVVGVLAGTVVGAFLILVVHPVKALWFVVFIIVLQQVESNLIYPRIVGQSVGLPGMWVLAAVTVGGALFGILGMLLAVPTFSVLYSLLRDAVQRRLSAKQPAD